MQILRNHLLAVYYSAIMNGQANKADSGEISGRSFSKNTPGAGASNFLLTLWEGQLNSYGDYNAVIRGFLGSAEYRGRFGPA
jgi:hypothetical protein